MTDPQRLSAPDAARIVILDFADLVNIMRRLCADDGCEWDKAQTHDSIRANAVEEAYELVEAIDNRDVANMREECGDVMGTFVGHDHNNDYAIMYKNILLAYGRYTGGNTVYNDLPNGCRVIVLKENERRFDSYIRLANGKIEYQITYPDSFNKQ